MCIHSPCSLMCFFKHTYVWFYFSCILYLVYAVASRFMSQHTERNRISTSAAFYAGSERNCSFINTSRAHLDRKWNFDSAPRKSVKSCFLLIQQVPSRIQFPRDNCIDDIYRWADGHGPGCWISTAATSLHPSSPSVTPRAPEPTPRSWKIAWAGCHFNFGQTRGCALTEFTAPCLRAAAYVGPHHWSLSLQGRNEDGVRWKFTGLKKRRL